MATDETIWAERPWPPSQSKREHVATRDNPDAMERCLTCPVPPEQCRGNCGPKSGGPLSRVRAGKQRKITTPASDPCPACRSRAVCEAHGGTCGERVRWEARKCR